MQGDEIEVPKELREFMPDKAELTKLGQKMAQTNSIALETCTLENMMIDFSYILTKLIQEGIH